MEDSNKETVALTLMNRWLTRTIKEFLQFLALSWIFKNSWNGFVPYVTHAPTLTYSQATMGLFSIWIIGTVFGTAISGALQKATVETVSDAWTVYTNNDITTTKD